MPRGRRGLEPGSQSLETKPGAEPGSRRVQGKRRPRGLRWEEVPTPPHLPNLFTAGVLLDFLRWSFKKKKGRIVIVTSLEFCEDEMSWCWESAHDCAWPR